MFQAGPLERVSIPKEKDGTQRSYGFITFKHQESVPYAIGIFAGTKLFNRDLRLNNRALNNGNGSNNRGGVNEAQIIMQQRQKQMQQIYQSQLEQTLQMQFQQFQKNSVPWLPNDLSPERNERDCGRDRDNRDKVERNRDEKHGSRNRVRDRSKARDREHRDRAERNDQARDQSALRGSTSLPILSQASMLPAANPFSQKNDELTNKGLDLSTLMALGANMLHTSNPLDIGSSSPHHLQSKMSQRQENRPHNQNNNYSRWNEHDRRVGGGWNERRDRGDFNRRNRHDRR